MEKYLEEHDPKPGRGHFIGNWYLGNGYYSGRFG